LLADFGADFLELTINPGVELFISTRDSIYSVPLTGDSRTQIAGPSSSNCRDCKDDHLNAKFNGIRAVSWLSPNILVISDHSLSYNRMVYLNLNAATKVLIEMEHWQDEGFNLTEDSLTADANHLYIGARGRIATVPYTSNYKLIPNLPLRLLFLPPLAPSALV